MKHVFTGRFLLMFSLLAVSFVLPASSTAANGHMAEVAQKMLADIHQATWIEEGKSAHVIYVFFDPNCPYCHQIYENTRDSVKQNAIQIRWVPVGVLTATSYGKAQTLLDAKDRLQAFYQNEEQFSESDGGNLDESLEGTEKSQQALKNNSDLLRLTGFDAVPSILFRASNGQAIIIQGSPPADKLKAILQYVG